MNDKKRFIQNVKCSLPAVRLSQQNSQKYFGNFIRYYFFRSFLFGSFTRFWLSTSSAIKLPCFTCIWNNLFNFIYQWSGRDRYGILFNGTIIWLWIWQPTHGRYLLEACLHSTGQEVFGSIGEFQNTFKLLSRTLCQYEE